MQKIGNGYVPEGAELKAEARKIFNSMKSGGVVVLPFDVSYAIFAHTARAVQRIYEIKNRSYAKPNGVLGNWEIFNEVIDSAEKDRDIVQCITLDHGLPLSIVGNYRADHDFFATTQFGALRRSSKGATMDLLMNAGDLHRELSQMSLDACTPLMGSSANKSLSGNKFELHHIEAEVTDKVDLNVDHGKCKYENPWLIGSTILELGTYRVLRFGCCYEQIQKILNAQFGLGLPDRPVSGSMSIV